MDSFFLFLRRNRWARAGLSVASVGLLVAAVVLLSYPLYTNWYQSQVQGRLRHQMASPTLKQAYRNHTLKQGDSLTRIRIPKIGVDVIVVQGTSASALRAGAGHYEDTPLPCDDGDIGIAGHRTTYGKPFANIDRLAPGDQIIFDTPVGSCTYEVTAAPVGRHAYNEAGAAFIVSPDDRSVVANTPGRRTLTLTSCHPKGSAAQRIVIKAAATKGPSAPA